jgi:excinuclease ABC subunit C
LYIGKAKDLAKRVQQYFSPGSVWKQEMVSRATKVDFITVTNESESLYLEDNLIKQYKPPFNSLLKGDNTYIFVRITNEAFPQVLFTRKRKSDGSIYI